MERKLPNDWQAQTLNEQNTSALQQDIKSQAAQICNQRASKSDNLRSEIEALKRKQNDLNSLINKVKNAVVAENDSDLRNSIERKCEDLRLAMGHYITNMVALQTRFQNQKIRVLSFGSKSQGKSSFTQAYSHLSDQIVGKKNGGNEDKTGATSIIIHKHGASKDNPEIHVVFRKRNDILHVVNECFAKLGISSYQFNTWDDLYEVLRNTTRKEEVYRIIHSLEQNSNSSITGFGSMHSMLENIFCQQSNFEDVNSGDESYFDSNRGKIIGLRDLSVYNDMQNKVKQCFTSVQEIRIYVDLGYGDMFENFELCDTKGLSIDAGGAIWERELYEVIGSCDAIFSIQATGSGAIGQGDKAFYEKLNDERDKNQSTLRDLSKKHFAIINPWAENNVANTGDSLNRLLDLLQSLNFVNTAYVGPLKDKVIMDGTECSLQQFVDYVIHDMMQKIVKTTSELDEKCISECRKSEQSINSLRNELVKLLKNYNDVELKNEDEIINDAIDEWLKGVGIVQVKNDIKRCAQQENILLTNFVTNTPPRPNNNIPIVENRNGIVAEQRTHRNGGVAMENPSTVTETLDESSEKIDQEMLTKRIYQMLTGKEAKTQFNTTNEVIKEAIKCLYNEHVKANVGKKGGKYKISLQGSYEDIGAYIDSASDLMYHLINDNVNRMFSPDGEMPDASSFRQAIFDRMWKSLKLDVFAKFNPDLFPKDSDIQIDNLRIQHWSVPYNMLAHIPAASPIQPPASFYILKYYFSKIANVEDDKIAVDYSKAIINHDELIKAFQQAYLKYDLQGRCKQKVSSPMKWKIDLLQQLWIDVQDSRYVDEVRELYKYLSKTQGDWISNLTNAGIINDSIKNEFDNQKRIQEMKNLYGELVHLQL